MTKGNTRSHWESWYLLAARWHVLGFPKGEDLAQVTANSVRSQERPWQCPAVSAPCPLLPLEELLLCRLPLLTLLLHTGMSCTLSSAESLVLLNLLETRSPAPAP